MEKTIPLLLVALFRQPMKCNDCWRYFMCFAFGYVIVFQSWRHLESALWPYLVTHLTPPPAYNATYNYYSEDWFFVEVQKSVFIEV